MQEKVSRKIQTDEPANTFGVGDQSTQPDSIVSNAGKDLPVEFGRYRLLKQLGEGGMGAVYLAHDTTLDRKVAIKLPHPTGNRSKDLSDRFRREARLAATLDHTNICRVFDIGEHQGRLYLTMAFVEGKSLHEIIKAKGAIEPRIAVTLLKRIATAVQFAHDRGIIHRDLKPANIMIKKDRDFVIMDFGLARRLEQEEEQLTVAGTVLGTPAYMAPELLRGETERVGPQSDVYSLGIMLFELLTGQRPFQGTHPQVYAQVLTSASITPSSIRSTIDSSLDTIYQRATHADVSQRFKSADEFATALGNYLVQPTQILDPLVRAAPVEDIFQFKPKVRSSLPPRRRNPTMLVAGGAAFFAIFLGVIVILIRNKDGTTTELRIADGAVAVEVKKDDRTIATLDLGSDDPKANQSTIASQIDVNRRAAQRVIELGGAVTVLLNGQRKELKAGVSLPKEPFEIDDINLWGNVNVRDADLKLFEKLDALKGIGISGTQVSDAGLLHLHGKTTLTRLDLGNTRISDAGLLAFLSTIPNLESLQIPALPVTDRVMARIGEYSLPFLNAFGTKIGDNGVLHLRGKQLGDYNLEGTQITDLGLLNLDGAGFDRLGVAATSITDAGLEHCKKFTKLGSIDLRNTKVTNAGIDSLQKAFPNCKIDHNSTTAGMTETRQSVKTPEEQMRLARIAELQSVIAKTPSVFDYDTHNELRHLYAIEGNLEKAFFHMDAILKNLPMADYIVQILSDHQIGIDNQKAIETLLNESKKFPEFQFVAAACWLKIGELETDPKISRGFFQRVMDLSGPQFEVYRELAKTEDAKLKVRSSPPLSKLANEQKIATWVVSSGGGVCLMGSDQWISDKSLLPKPLGMSISKITFFETPNPAVQIQIRDLAALTSAQSLEELNLRGQMIGDPGARIVAQMQQLKVLNLHASGISDASLTELSRLKNLEILDLGYSNKRITDRGAEKLAKLQGLTELNIYDSSITDKTLLDVLGKLPKLRFIEVTGTNVTARGVEKFKLMQPDCIVLKDE